MADRHSLQREISSDQRERFGTEPIRILNAGFGTPNPKHNPTPMYRWMDIKSFSQSRWVCFHCDISPSLDSIFAGHWRDSIRQLFIYGSLPFHLGNVCPVRT